MSTGQKIEPEAVTEARIRLGPNGDRELAEAVINYMRERLDRVTTRKAICAALGWPEDDRQFGPTMSMARRVADEQDLHLTFYLWDLGGYVLTAEDVEVAIKAVRSRVRAWAVSAANIGRTGRFIDRHAKDTVRRRLGRLLDTMSTQATTNMTEVAAIIDLHEQDVHKRQIATAKKAARQAAK